ncbi:hypothetical protein T01_7736 [Trichinella spiralis]|uniref:Uncharacterized protein n=1 Tax=Trichinella spiralis TaxID=6334 RepID=A0A0V1BG03_TRISP|nr:hypothetical protein T01_7736 [Trichinella spiralis]
MCILSCDVSSLSASPTYMQSIVRGRRLLGFFLSQKCTTNLAQRRQRWSLYRPVSTSESSDGIAWGGRAAPVTSFSHQRDGFSTFSDTLRNSTSVSTLSVPK